MPRVRKGSARRKAKKRLFREARGNRGGRGKLLRTVKETVVRSRAYAYRDRRNKKRAFRRLWQIRINAAARAAGMTYSRFMEGLKAAKIDLDRKVLADIAATDSQAFGQLVQVAQDGLKAKAA